MSGEKSFSPCSKFQANIFNKSKCQNCFKSRELHLFSEHDPQQAKPIYAGWLCLAPQGTDFDNPMQRSRKWQRRFFILYEHGCLSFALDELPTTLPQGTVNLNLCTDLVDAEPRTGQRNALCVITSEQEIFIRGENKEIIHGWSEQLAVYLRTNKQNQKKKRKVEPVTQEPSPAKMAATDPTESGRGRWQEEQRGRGPDVTPFWTVTADTARGLEQTPTETPPAHLTRLPSGPVTLDGVGTFGSPVLDSPANGNSGAGAKNQVPESDNARGSAGSRNRSQDRSRGDATERILGLETTGTEQEEAVGCRGRSEGRSSSSSSNSNSTDGQSCGDVARLGAPPTLRRAKSLDRRSSDTVMTPDLLNFKKGWLVKQDGNDQWKKYWFVLSIDTLRYYKDSVTEEAADLEGEIDLTRCFNVSEYEVQRNYGFQIHTPKAVHTLSAMTAGIRKNWIQSLMKNVHPAHAPDVTSLPGHHLPKPDVTQDSRSSDLPADRDLRPKRTSVLERRREGRYRTFDWAEFRPQRKATPLESDRPRVAAPCPLELGDQERRRRREERRRRYEDMLGVSLNWEKARDATQESTAMTLSPRSQMKMEEDIEERWKQVERTMFKLDRTVPLFPKDKDTGEMEKLLESYRDGVKDLKVQLAESERRRLELEAQLLHPQVTSLDPPPGSDENISSSFMNEESSNIQAKSLEHKEMTELSEQEQQELKTQSSTSEQPPSIWLQDTGGNFREVGAGVTTPLLSSSADNQLIHSKSDEQVIGLDFGGKSDNYESSSFTSETETHKSDYDSTSLILENHSDDRPLGCLVEQHVPPDPAMVRRLSQEVELLTSQNEALNQRNQEMLNQLTEADREIERLKAELSSRYTEAHHLPEVEQQEEMRADDLERELNLRNQELLDAQALVASLKEKLREMEAQLQLKADKERKEKSEQRAEGYLLRCFEATEAKLMELERQLEQSERDRVDLQLQNAELKESERFYLESAVGVEADIRRMKQELEMQLQQSEANCRDLHVQNVKLKELERLNLERAAQAEDDIRRLKQELEEEQLEKERKRHVSGEERTRQVIKGMIVRLNALGKLLEVIDKLSLLKQMEDEDKVSMENFWSLLLKELQASRLELEPQEEECVEVLLKEVIEHMIVERQMLELGHSLLLEVDSSSGEALEPLKDLDLVSSSAIVTETETEKTNKPVMFDFITSQCQVVHFQTTTHFKISSLDRLSSSLTTLAPKELAHRLKDSHFLENSWFGLVHSAATEALYCCRLNLLQNKLEETKQKALSCCRRLEEENKELKERLQLLEGQQASSCEEKGCQTDVEPQITEFNRSVQQNEESHQEILPNLEMQEVLELRRRLEELEEVLGELTREFDGKTSSAQKQHESEVEKLKATCQRGFISMEESHLKIVEELQRLHQQEVERLLVEREQLLEEESAATATAIGAIKNAHSLELEREVRKRCRTENINKKTNLQEIHRQHSEELTSYHRELEALSQQFSLKCLENGHLVQALDAERKALCQCQQENQDLRTRNQELSGHLAAEITRLCSLAKQDELPLSQGMDVYEMEITLRVKESEVQCLKQQIASLKEELQAAHREKRNATKRYKDTFTELNFIRVKTEREIEELRENLRLTHQALENKSP